jgi:hypothetical protein
MILRAGSTLFQAMTFGNRQSSFVTFVSFVVSGSAVTANPPPPFPTNFAIPPVNPILLDLSHVFS